MPTNRFGDHSSSGHLSRILDDKTPQLGGMLDGNGFTFNGAVAFEAQAGEALSKGNAVYVSGVSGNKPVVMKADADDAAKMPAFGIAETDANLHANVNVVTFGTVYEIDTSAYAAGDELYVSTTPGVLTATKPSGATAKLQNIGKVIRSHASAGSIKVGGAGRTNAVPNLDDGTVFIGDSNNQAEQRALVLADISDYVAPTETDPVYTASSWYTTTNNSSNWDTAYGWGDHSSAGYATSFNSLSAKDGGTGTYRTSGYLQSGTSGSGMVSLTTNDGGGNANVTFNHAGNAPDNAGYNTGRITVNVDSTSGAYMGLSVGSGGVAPNNGLTITESGISTTGTVTASAGTFTGKLTVTNSAYDNHIELNRSSEQWRFSPSTDGSLDIRRVSGTGDAIVDLPKTIVTDSLGTTTISGAGFSTNRSIAYIGTATTGQQLRFQSDVVTVYDQSNTVNRFQVSSTGISTNGTVTASGGNSTNWNSAYSDTSAATHVNTGSTLVRRTANGDSYHRYLYTTNVYMSSGINTTTPVTRFAASYDGWLRWADATTTRAGLDVPTRTGGNASGTWGINITGNAGDSDKQSMFDTRAALLDPNSYPDFSIYGEFTNKINGSWWSAITAKGWHDGYAAWQLIGYSSTGTDNRLYFKNSHGTNNTWSSLQQIWHSGSDGSGSGLDADTVDGVDSSRIIFGDNSTGTTAASPTGILKSGFYNNHTTGVPTSTWYSVFHCRHSNTANNFGHQIAGSFYSTGDIYNRNINNNTFGAWTKIWNASNDGSGSGLDADTVDGIQGGSLLRSDATDYLTGAIYTRNYLIAEDAYRNKGIVGTYVSTKTQQIWAMSTSYLSSASGANFGSLYGLAYKHTNNATGGTMAGGHQMVWCQAGTGYAAMGTNIWTSGNVTAYSDIRVKTNLEVIPDALAKVCKLNGYTFDRTDVKYDDHGNPTVPVRQTGVVAQEVLEVLPEAVTGDEESHYNVAYGNMVGLLIEAIKEQQAQIEELKEMIKCQ